MGFIVVVILIGVGAATWWQMNKEPFVSRLTPEDEEKLKDPDEKDLS